MQQVAIQQCLQRIGTAQDDAIFEAANAVEQHTPTVVLRPCNCDVLSGIKQWHVGCAQVASLMLNALTGEVLPQVRGFTQVLAGGAGLNGGAEL